MYLFQDSPKHFKKPWFLPKKCSDRERKVIFRWISRLWWILSSFCCSGETGSTSFGASLGHGGAAGGHGTCGLSGSGKQCGAADGSWRRLGEIGWEGVESWRFSVALWSRCFLNIGGYDMKKRGESVSCANFFLGLWPVGPGGPGGKDIAILVASRDLEAGVGRGGGGQLLLACKEVAIVEGSQVALNHLKVGSSLAYVMKVGLYLLGDMTWPKEVLRRKNLRELASYWQAIQNHLRQTEVRSSAGPWNSLQMRCCWIMAYLPRGQGMRIGGSTKPLG